MKKYLLITLLFNLTLTAQNDTINNPITEGINNLKFIEEYPKGIYNTLADFKNKIPNSTENFTIEDGKSSIAYRFVNDSKKKIKNAFAISDGENLFLNIKSIITNFDESGNGQACDGGNYYLKVYFTNKYLFMSHYFASTAAYILGGLIGIMASRREKGIIFDEKNDNFHLFKNYKEFKNFIKQNYYEQSDLLIKYSNPKIPEIIKIRSIIEQL
jgi:hypothetical protein